MCVQGEDSLVLLPYNEKQRASTNEHVRASLLAGNSSSKRRRCPSGQQLTIPTYFSLLIIRRLDRIDVTIPMEEF
ncbi:hypothetical protein DPMN_185662 [Dreissena polymorpha]|uniref:Uncharacterized protein n=1 Tax=Dreissena polymorpha TaxID=45954 RepID=A0A9D4DN81_DREPO|nr:hypothetical protein DPMN_185662 [Dreissena polymorpha]